ncbi:MAG: nicotinate phosphoribosyltransferase [Hoeflea sp.]|jgi:nicotinamide phosphoribosyltransferase|uniref:nicotinate phosphoribosyltransferase n=1 Tax=Hoeflea sp. TaxID=1940281 RepID=UPI0032EEECEA
MGNLILATDSYKASHFKQYPPGTTRVTSYIEARVGGNFKKVLFFGLQAFIKEYLSKPICLADIDEAEFIFEGQGMPFNRDGWVHILRKHNGYMPVVIEALPEGVVVPVGTPLVQIYNTDPACFWLTSYLETALLRAIWYPSTVATLSWYSRQTLGRFVEQTTDGDASAILDFMLHDFGARGVSSGESAMLGGMAHLINFKGTDTVEGLIGAMRYYDAGEVVGFSVPASEHSTMTSWGEDREDMAYANMLRSFPDGIVSIVADSYDYMNAVDNIFGDQLKAEIIERGQRGGRTVIRPDSGDPVKTVMFTLNSLAHVFECETNTKGFRVLPAYIRVLWGDGIDLTDMTEILYSMRVQGWAAENIVFGMGGGLLQKVNRDSLRFAMKANQIEVDGVSQPISKSPKTDPSKGSKAGTQAVFVKDGKYKSMRSKDFYAFAGDTCINLLQNRYANGQTYSLTDFEAVRQRAKHGLYEADIKKVA